MKLNTALFFVFLAPFFHHSRALADLCSQQDGISVGGACTCDDIPFDPMQSFCVALDYHVRPKIHTDTTRASNQFKDLNHFFMPHDREDELLRALLTHIPRELRLKRIVEIHTVLRGLRYPPSEVLYLVKSLSSISEVDWPYFVRQGHRLSAHLGDDERHSFYSYFSSMPADERVAFVDRIDRLYGHLDFSDHLLSLSAPPLYPHLTTLEEVCFSLLPADGLTPEQIHEFIFDFIQLNDNISGAYGLFSVEQDNYYEELLRVYTDLIRRVRGIEDRFRLLRVLVQHVSGEDEAQLRARRAHHELDAQRVHTMERLVVILETPTHEPLPPLLGGMVAAAAGGAHAVNVHADDREVRTRTALQLLIRSQSDHSPEEIHAARLRFLDRVAALPEGDPKNDILLVLYSENSRIGVGGLLVGTQQIMGLPGLSGPDLLGRVSLFADNCPELDREAAYSTLLSALLQSFETKSDGTRGIVCDFGKAQRLLMVLQGRFPGADIDDLASIMGENQLTASHENIDTIQRSFWTPARTTMPRNQMIAQVIFFLDEQPRLRQHRAAFQASLMADIDSVHPEDSE